MTKECETSGLQTGIALLPRVTLCPRYVVLGLHFMNTDGYGITVSRTNLPKFSLVRDDN
jgi:hypothetical protein